MRQLEEQIQAILHPVVDEQEESIPKKAKPKRKAISKDVRIALNTIKQSLTMVTKSGITVKTEEEDTEEYYQITVKIPKKKSVINYFRKIIYDQIITVQGDISED